jgi:predicted nucleotidyltransferase component of viral defense system
MNEANFPPPHEADSDIFREALAYSEATTGFTATLIEKDYYCSLVLQYFFDGDTSLVFKGGTCLSKIYADFYRLSEDLDFIIPVTAETSRSQRRVEIEPVKLLVNELPALVPGLTVSRALRGHNESRQYIGHLEYQSAVIEKQERIKLEVGLREPLLSPSVSNAARTIAVNPFSGLPILTTFTVRTMAKIEAYAEKVRAALSRREPAIRDFFDLFYAVHEMGLDFRNPDFLSMVRAKLEVPGNDPVDLSADRQRELNRQLEGQLKPVLRPADFVSFNLDEAFELVCSIAKVISV